MSAVLTEVVIESTDPLRAATFWSEALGWELREHMPGNVPWISASGNPEELDLKLVFVAPRDKSHLRNRLYVNPSGCDLHEEVVRLCELGAQFSDKLLDGTTETASPWVTLVDPGGTSLTVLPARVD